MAESGGRGTRLRSLVGLGFRRVVGRVLGVEPQRVLLATLGVALAVGLLLTVTGLSLGLAGGTTVRSQSVDYWIVPEGGGGTSIAVTAAGPKLGDTHAVAARLAEDDRVRFATPVLIQVVQVEHPDAATREQILAIGVVPPDDGMEIAGLETDFLTPGDPYHDAAGAAASWTGEVVITEAAGTFLEAETGSRLRVESGDEAYDLRVADVSTGDAGSGFGQLPVAVMHLSELQAITGGSEADVADQMLVSTGDPGVKSTLEDVYPGTIVVGKQGLGTSGLLDSGLPLALAVVAFLTALGVGALFVATMMGLEVTADRRNLAVLGALGFSTRARSILVGVETVTIATLGGVLGVVLGAAGIYGLNAGIGHYLGVEGVAVFHPVLPAYGLGLAVLVGLLAAPYPIVRARRTDLLEVIARGPG